MNDWVDWWNSASWGRRWGPLLVALTYWTIALATGLFTMGHLVLVSLPLGLHYLGPRGHLLRDLALPVVIILIVYDSQRLWVEDLRGPIHVADLHAAELAWFGVEQDGEVITLARWWQTRTHPVMDIVTGLAYLSYVPAFFFCVWRYWRRGHDVRGVMWTFLVLNLSGYALYVIYPAAPPWYVDLYGLTAVQSDVPGNPAGAARFDEIVGSPIFANIYGQNANVFGAMPSLHVAVPFLALLFSVRFRSARAFSATMFGLIAFAAVYLNHHYIWDILVGLALALAAFALNGVLWPGRERG